MMSNSDPRSRLTSWARNLRKRQTQVSVEWVNELHIDLRLRIDILTCWYDGSVKVILVP